MMTIGYTFYGDIFISSYKRAQEEEKQVNVDKDQLQGVNQIFWSHLQRLSFKHGWIDLPVVDIAAQTSRLAFLYCHQSYAHVNKDIRQQRHHHTSLAYWIYLAHQSFCASVKDSISDPMNEGYSYIVIIHAECFIVICLYCCPVGVTDDSFMVCLSLLSLIGILIYFVYWFPLAMQRSNYLFTSGKLNATPF